MEGAATTSPIAIIRTAFTLCIFVLRVLFTRVRAISMTRPIPAWLAEGFLAADLVRLAGRSEEGFSGGVRITSRLPRCNYGRMIMFSCRCGTGEMHLLLPCPSFGREKAGCDEGDRDEDNS